MLSHTAFSIIGYADVKNSMVRIGEHVNVVGVHARSFRCDCFAVLAMTDLNSYNLRIVCSTMRVFHAANVPATICLRASCTSQR